MPLTRQHVMQLLRLVGAPLLLAAVAAWSSYLIASAFGDKEPAVAVAAGDAPATDAIVAAPLPIAAPETAAAAADPAPTVPQANLADFAVDPAPEAEPASAGGRTKRVGWAGRGGRAVSCLWQKYSSGTGQKPCPLPAARAVPPAAAAKAGGSVGGGGCKAGSAGRTPK
jgi:hypothetical protein